MIRSFGLNLFCTLLLTAMWAEPLFALGTTPDKPQNASISLGAEYASGKYGTDKTTRSMYLPLIATWSPNERVDMGIEIPFLYQNNANVTTDLYRKNQQSTTAAKGGPTGANGAFLQQGSGGPGGSTASGDASDASVSGLGDIIVRLGAIALQEGVRAPRIRSSLFIKLPTANSSDGLGTGEFDAGIGVDLTKWYNDLHLLGEGVYVWQGRAAGFGLKNYFSYTAAVGYQLTADLEPMVMVTGATAPSDYSSELLELRVRLIWSLTGATTLDLFGSCGIADSSPDYGGGIALIYSF